MEAVPLRALHGKENLPPVSSADQIGPKPLVGIRPFLTKSGGMGMARKPLADVTHLFIGGGPALTRSSSATVSNGLSVPHLPSLCPKKRRALDDVGLLRATTARSAKSLRMGFR
ncbi:uncharacterized protein J3R85_004301 [Psidium guajava]|nr:uncharacterized protein J3R85_004301 [Psidium guajava]